MWLCDKASERKVKGRAARRVGAALGVERDRGRHGDLFQEGHAMNPPAPKPRSSTPRDGEPGTVLNRSGPHEYEVMTDHGIEVWQEDDIQAADEEG